MLHLNENYCYICDNDIDNDEFICMWCDDIFCRSILNCENIAFSNYLYKFEQKNKRNTLKYLIDTYLKGEQNEISK